jgi:hypothetical protein
VELLEHGFPQKENLIGSLLATGDFVSYRLLTCLKLTPDWCQQDDSNESQSCGQTVLVETFNCIPLRQSLVIA